MSSKVRENPLLTCNWLAIDEYFVFLTPSVPEQRKSGVNSYVRSADDGTGELWFGSTTSEWKAIPSKDIAIHQETGTTIEKPCTSIVPLKASIARLLACNILTQPALLR